MPPSQGFGSASGSEIADAGRVSDVSNSSRPIGIDGAAGISSLGKTSVGFSRTATGSTDAISDRGTIT